jgi:hypothetical protein
VIALARLPGQISESIWASYLRDRDSFRRRDTSAERQAPGLIPWSPSMDKTLRIEPWARRDVLSMRCPLNVRSCVAGGCTYLQQIRPVRVFQSSCFRRRSPVRRGQFGKPFLDLSEQGRNTRNDFLLARLPPGRTRRFRLDQQSPNRLKDYGKTPQHS